MITKVKNAIKDYWFSIPIGTRSVLVGAHAFYLHPWFLAWSWYRLYGIPWDPRYWFCFFLHDIGYIGKPNMDGDEGETHPLLGAKIIRKLFGQEWGDFCICHSRFYAKRLGKRYSRLCVADKYAIVVTPSWIYLPMVQLTGELREYMDIKRESKYYESNFNHATPYDWHQSIKKYIGAWVVEHKEADREDSWLKGNATEISDVTDRLPGYLEGDYEHDKYMVLKKDGTPINPNAKYMVVRYDKDRDPHGIFSTIAYAISVESDNKDLSLGIMRALTIELGMSQTDFEAKYFNAIRLLRESANLFENANY